jgi:hypothetical protein
MADEDQPLASASDPNAASPAVPASINMPDSAIRQHWFYQLFVRLPRPALDWFTAFSVLWCLVIQPWAMGRFDPIATGLTLTWAATVYGFKFAEKIKGVA